MSYTKEKLYMENYIFGKAKGIAITHHSDDEGTPLIIAFCWTEGCEITQRANARRILQCWNNHDDLVLACEEGLHECERIKMHCDCPDKNLISLLLRIERIEKTLEQAESRKQ